MNQALTKKLLGWLSPQRWLAVWASAVALTLVGGYVNLVHPSVTEYRQLESERESELSQLEQRGVETTPERVADLEAQIGELRDELFGGSSSVPPEKIESFIIDRLDRLSARHRVELLGVVPETPGHVLMFQELPYEVQVSGDYRSLYEWLVDAERELRPLVVKTFEMRPAARTTGVDLQLRLVAYRAEGNES